MKKKFEDISGMRFGNQVVIKRCHQTKKWLVVCDCGKEKWRLAGNIKRAKRCPACACKKYIGKKFGKLLIIEIEKYKKSKAVVKAKCDCGNIKSITLPNILTGHIRSCGCLRIENQLKAAAEHIGQKFGYLTIKKIIGYQEKTHKIKFLCRCKCGNEKIILLCKLGGARSCGCLLKEAALKSENHPRATLKNKEVRSIREIIKLKIYSKTEISKMFNVSIGVIWRIEKNRSYKSIL